MRKCDARFSAIAELLIFLSHVQNFYVQYSYHAEAREDDFYG